MPTIYQVQWLIYCSCIAQSKVPKDEAHGGGGQDAVSAHIVNGANEQEAEGSYDYDLIVLGGGSGGLAAAKVRSYSSITNTRSQSEYTREAYAMHTLVCTIL